MPHGKPMSNARKSQAQRVQEAIDKVKGNKSKANVDNALQEIRVEDALKISERGLTSDKVEKWKKSSQKKK